MAEQRLLNTTPTCPNPLVLEDLSGFYIVPPLVDYDLLEEYSVEEVLRSSELFQAIDDGYLTLKTEGGIDINGTREGPARRETYAFTGVDLPYIKCSESSWTVVAYILWPGKAISGTPTEVWATAWAKDNGDRWRLRIRSREESGNIAVGSNKSNNNPDAVLVDDSLTESNITDGWDVWEVQMRSPDGNEFYLSSLHIIF